MLSLKSAFSLSSRASLVPLHFLPFEWYHSTYQRLLIFLPAFLIPACDSSSPTFHMMYSVYKLNKQCDNTHHCHTLFPIVNQSVVPCLVLTTASWSAYRFLKRQVRWSGIPITFTIFHKFVVVHTLKGFSVVNAEEVEASFGIPLLLHDPINVGNLLTGSSVSSKASSDIWKLSVHIQLKASLKDPEHYLASLWNECNCEVVWTFLGIALLWVGRKTDLY